ncbi:MAG: magnesium transporter [Planctomycetes bacterium]|nr:magnesium transporter [Planctomycetota bacterium]
MTGPELEPQIRQLLSERDFAAVKAVLSELETADIAELLAQCESDEQALAFRLLSLEQAADVFSLLPLENQGMLVEHMSQASVADILNEMSPDDRTELLEEVPGELAKRLLASLRGEERAIARALLNYPADSVGRLMTPEYVAVRPAWTVEAVLEHIRKVAPQKETVNDLYVINNEGKLLDHIQLQDVVLAPAGSTVESLMSGPTEEPSLMAQQDQEAAVELFKKYDTQVLPVVDRRGVLVGIVTGDDVLDLQEQVDTEDFQKLAGVTALEDPYFQTSYLKMVVKRLPWLTFLLAAELLTALAIASHEDSMREHIWLLILFMPMVNASAGNVGSQMAGLVIRGLAVQEMKLGDWLRIGLRELRMGLTLGVILAAMAWASAILFGRPWQVAVILVVSMLSALTIANLAGAMIPLALKRIRLDPAVTSAPLIASLMDALSAVIFFGTATVIFHYYG